MTHRRETGGTRRSAPSTLFLMAAVVCLAAVLGGSFVEGTAAADPLGGDVYYVAPWGSDSNPGTESQPWRTISKAADSMGPGSTVFVREGTYYESVWLHHSGAPGQRITFRNYPGEVPCIESPGGDTSGFVGSDVDYITIQGFVLRGFQDCGISCGWNGACNNLEVMYNIVDDNGTSGVHVSHSNEVIVAYNMASRNGWGEGWSSGFDIYGMAGQDNQVVGNVAFNNVDESDHHTDGHGLILDMSFGDGGATFANNVAFHNGGAGIAVTRSSHARIVGNTLYQNVQDERMFDGSGWGAELIFDEDESYYDVLMRNNVAVPLDGTDALRVTRDFVNSEIDHNSFDPGPGEDPAFVDPENADFQLQVSSQLIDQGSIYEAPEYDIGFDSQCIRQKKSGQRYSWWYYEPDVDHIRSIGGVENCFSPTSRLHGAGPDLGANEYAGEPPEPTPTPTPWPTPEGGVYEVFLPVIHG